MRGFSFSGMVVYILATCSAMSGQPTISRMVSPISAVKFQKAELIGVTGLTSTTPAAAPTKNEHADGAGRDPTHSLAEYHYLNGELLPAIEQLELGLRDPDLSPNQEAQLRARLKQFRAEAIAQNLPVSKQATP